MEENKKIESKIILDFYIKTLTPVHIGAAQEQHLSKGVDYLTKNGKIYFIDEKKILVPPHGTGSFRIDQYTNSLALGSLQKLLKNNNLSAFSYQVVDTVIGEVGSDIKKHISNTMDGKPYIPGTSLKGAIRSVIFNKSKNQRDRRESNTFGRIQEDPFRYLIVGDAFFEDSKYINTKTFNLFKNGNGWQGGWKHGFHGNNSENFKSSGFTFPYECIPPNSLTKCHLVLNKNAYLNASQKQEEINKINNTIFNPQKKIKPILKKVKLFSDLTGKNDLNLLLITIKEYTKNYLNKEIAFFKKYSNNETEKIIAEYKRLLELNETAPVLRVGQGSGFHSITGDWKFEDHTSPIEKKEHKKYKSRRFAFTKINDDFYFYPMGFVQLLLPDQIKNELESIEKQKKEKAIKDAEERKILEAAAIKAKKEAIEKEEQERKAKEERLKPKMVKKADFKKGKLKLIDGEVTGSAYGKVMYKVFVEEFQNEQYEFNYQAGLKPGTVLQVNALITKKGKLNIQGTPIVKR